MITIYAKRYNIFVIWDYFFLLFSINVILFAVYVANPFPFADNWTFINTFVKKIVDHTLTIEDFYRARGSSDHAQPIQKFMLLIHTKVYSLDYSFDTIASIIVGLITIRWLSNLIISNSNLIEINKLESSNLNKLIYLLLLLAVPFSLLSFNVTVQYTYTLVGQFFVTLPFILWFYYAYAKFMSGDNGSICLILSTFFIILLLDTLGVIAVFSALFYLVLTLTRQNSLDKLVRTLIVLIPVTFLARLIVHGLQPKSTTSSFIINDVLKSFSNLLMHWSDILYWITIPASSSFMHRTWIESIPTKKSEIFTIVVGFIVISFHYWFWRMWYSRQKNFLGVFAALLMLYSYFSTVAILVFRVSEYGTDYLYAPRYVILSYEVSILALLVMLCSVINSNQLFLKERINSIFLFSLLFSFIIVQLIYIDFAWKRSWTLRNIQRNTAQLMLALGDTPDVKLPVCAQSVALCKAINQNISLLKTQKLSLFSPEFNRRHNLSFTDR